MTKGSDAAVWPPRKVDILEQARFARQTRLVILPILSVQACLPARQIPPSIGLPVAPMIDLQ